MSRPIAVVTDGYLVGDGISPKAIGSDGYLVSLNIPIPPEPEPEPAPYTGPRIVGTVGMWPELERRKRIARDDNEVFAIIERFFH